MHEQRFESNAWLAPFIPTLTSAGERVLEVGCGSLTDAQLLADHGFVVVACDRRLPERVSSVHSFAADLRRLPVRDRATDIVLASLCLHYLPWDATLDAAQELRRVLRPQGRLLSRVNASDDVNYGAGSGEELEPGYFATVDTQGRVVAKRFFDEESVRAAFERWFSVQHLEHRVIDRYGPSKRVWECLATRRG